MGSPLGPKYVPYTYMDPLGMMNSGKLQMGPQLNAVPSWRRAREGYPWRYGGLRQNSALAKPKLRNIL